VLHEAELTGYSLCHGTVSEQIRKPRGSCSITGIFMAPMIIQGISRYVWTRGRCG
jgi:hypothetical protein